MPNGISLTSLCGGNREIPHSLFSSSHFREIPQWRRRDAASAPVDVSDWHIAVTVRPNSVSRCRSAARKIAAASSSGAIGTGQGRLSLVYT